MGSDTYQERERANQFAYNLFKTACGDMRHEFAMWLEKVGEENTTAHQHMSEREAIAMVHDALERCVSMRGARREWVKLAATALGHVVALDINAGHISPALPGVER